MITREDFARVFKKLADQIEDRALREKTLDVWVEAARRGNWTSIEDIQKMPFSQLTDCKGVNLLEHTMAVTEGALGLARAQRDNYRQMPFPLDMDRLIAGGLLHDVGKLLETEPDGKGGWRMSLHGRCARHPISGAMIAAEKGLPMQVVNMIICHAKEGEGRPQVPEGFLVHQADFATFDPLQMLKKGDLIV